MLNRVTDYLWYGISPDLSTIVVRSFPFFNTKSIINLWWPFLRQDELLFNVVLCLSAVSLDALRYPNIQGYSTRLMTECIRLLQQRVADPSNGVSDETIIAVANLMAIEVSVLSESYRSLALMLSAPAWQRQS